MSLTIEGIKICGAPEALDFHEVVGWSIEKDLYGFDQLTRPYEGPITKLATWLALQARGKKDTTFAYLSLVDVQASGDVGGIVKANLVFKGTIAPDFRPVLSSRPKIQRMTMTSLGSLNSTEVEYYAPCTIIRYVSREQPVARSFENTIIRTEDDFKIVQQRGAQGQVTIVDKPKENKKYTGTTGGFTARARFFSHPVAMEQVGEYWQCEEQNEGRLVDVLRLEPVSG